LFAQTQKALADSENLYRITQELLSARDEETVFKLAMEALSQSGAESASIYMYLDSQETAFVEPILEQKAGWAATGFSMSPNGTRFKASDMVIDELVPQSGMLLLEDTIDNDPRLTEQFRQELALRGIKSLVALPLSTFQSRLGFLLVTYRTKDKTFTPQQIRFYNTIAQQMVVALENLRLLAASQRRARREEIIREITGRIRSATNVEDILKTTVTELSKVLGASQGGITLGLGPSAPTAELQAGSEPQNRSIRNHAVKEDRPEIVGNKESKRHGQ
jgi:GAF domain-containing protein